MTASGHGSAYATTAALPLLGECDGSARKYRRKESSSIHVVPSPGLERGFSYRGMFATHFGFYHRQQSKAMPDFLPIVSCSATEIVLPYGVATVAAALVATQTKG